MRYRQKGSRNEPTLLADVYSAGTWYTVQFTSNTTKHAPLSVCLCTHLLIRSPTLVHSLTHPITQQSVQFPKNHQINNSPNHSPIHSPIHSLIRSFTQSLNHSSKHSLNHSLTQSTQSLNLITHLLTPSLWHSHTHTTIYSPTPSYNFSLPHISNQSAILSPIWSITRTPKNTPELTQTLNTDPYVWVKDSVSP